MNRTSMWLIGLALLVGGPSLGANPSDAPIILRLHGSNTVGDKLAPALVTAFLRQHDPAAELPRDWTPGDIANEKYLAVRGTRADTPERVWVRAHGSGTAFYALKAGEAEIGMASRRITARELMQLTPLGSMVSPDAEHVIALDGLAIVVHPDNPLKSLSLAQIQGIFECTVLDWKDVGGNPGPIVLYARDDKSGTFDTFKSLVLQQQPLCAEARRFEAHTELADAVARDPKAIGFTGAAYVGSAKALAIQGCGVAYAPEAFAIKTEDYPLTRRLYLYNSPKAISPMVSPLIAFVQSDEGQREVAEAGFVDLRIASSPSPDTSPVEGSAQFEGVLSAEKADAMADYAEASKDARRLSITLRFAGETVFDERARRDIARLAGYLQGQDDQHLLLLGFANAGEGADSRLSLARAEMVAAQLRKLGVEVPKRRVFGIVEKPAAACDNEGEVLRKRRVEVWVKR